MRDAYQARTKNEFSIAFPSALIKSNCKARFRLLLLLLSGHKMLL